MTTFLSIDANTKTLNVQSSTKTTLTENSLQKTVFSSTNAIVLTSNCFFLKKNSIFCLVLDSNEIDFSENTDYLLYYIIGSIIGGILLIAMVIFCSFRYFKSKVNSEYNKTLLNGLFSKEKPMENVEHSNNSTEMNYASVPPIKDQCTQPEKKNEFLTFVLYF